MLAKSHPSKASKPAINFDPSVAQTPQSENLKPAINFDPSVAQINTIISHAHILVK